MAKNKTKGRKEGELLQWGGVLMPIGNIKGKGQKGMRVNESRGGQELLMFKGKG